jgi:hypothetical protein
MPETELTTIQIDKETRDRLRHVAEYNERSVAAQVRWFVNREYDRIFRDSEGAHAPQQEPISLERG